MAKILVVDDEEQIRTLLRVILESVGHEVEEAGNGIEALESYRRNPADLILMDIIMPEKEGIETIMELRQTYPDVKIIAMSGTDPDSPYLVMSKHLGADHIIDKPFSAEEIIDGIKELLKL